MHDVRDNPISTREPAAAERAECALWRLVSFCGDATVDLRAATGADPGWALPDVLHAGFLATLTQPSVIGEARALLAAAAPRLGAANARERAHFVAAQAAVEGRWSAACDGWDAILLDHPRDLAALLYAHLFDFYRGDARNLRLRVARVLPAWATDDPLYPYVLGMYAFGLEECNLYAQAEAAGREAASGRASVAWAIHAVAHVMEMQARHAEGLAWLREQEPIWSVDNGMSVHNWWHGALFHLETLAVADALAVYDRAIGVDSATFELQRLDAASLLWRLRLMGADVGDRWTRLAAAWTEGGAVDQVGLYAFNDAHLVMALIGAGQRAQAEAIVARVAERAAQAQGDNRLMALAVGLPLMRGLLAFDAGDGAASAEQLYRLRDGAHRFGGSHAQRDLIEQTLLAATSARGGPRALGRALLHERRLAKPETPLTAWWAERVLA